MKMVTITKRMMVTQNFDHDNNENIVIVDSFSK